MIIFFKEDSPFSKYFSCIKSDVENHEAVFMIEDLSEVNELDEDSICLSTSSSDLNTLKSLDLSSFRDIYLLFNSSDNDSVSSMNFLVTAHNITKIFDISLTGCTDILINSIKKNRSIRDENKLLKSQVLMLAHKLERTLDQFDTELSKIKKIYKKMVPFRQSSFKGIELKSKFFTGESAGGEYFDLHENGKKLLLATSSCSSYLMSSCYMTQFSQLKAYKNITDENIEEFKKNLDIEYEVISESSSKDVMFEHCFLDIDLSTLEVSFFNQGNFFLIGSNGIVISAGNKETGTVRLERGEKYFLISPGFLSNWEFYGNSSFIHEEIKEKFNNDSSDIIDELAIQIKSKAKSSFLKYDASIISIEVGENVIHEI